MNPDSGEYLESNPEEPLDSQMTVLIADDDPVTRMLLQKSLESWGYKVIVAEDGAQAQNAVKQHPEVQLFVIDWGMPNLDGVQFSRQLKNEEDGFYYIIMLTGRKGTERVVEAMTAGVDDFITKPFVADELRVRLKVGERIIEQERRLSFFANRDALTAVWNRRMILNLLKEEWERSVREQSQLCIALLDIDNFKLVNDHYGHAVGDHALKHFCQIINQRVRPYDKFGRYGGEEFLLILPNADLSDACSIVERFRATVEETPLPLKNHEPLKLTVSIGVSECQSGNKNVAMLFKECDKALYQAKSQGRNRVVKYEPQK